MTNDVTLGKRALPCEGCGTDVVVLSIGEIGEYWGDGLLVAWCADCYPKEPESK